VLVVQPDVAGVLTRPGRNTMLSDLDYLQRMLWHPLLLCRPSLRHAGTLDGKSALRSPIETDCQANQSPKSSRSPFPHPPPFQLTLSNN
jgi:hypothetical protein